jgi:hypothetical protein
LKYYKTQKLFYGEYLYKVYFYNELNGFFRTEFQKKGTLSYAREKLDQLTEYYRNSMPMQTPIYRTFKNVDEETYLDARFLYATLLRSKTNYRVRVESFNRISIFSNDEKFIDKIANGLRTQLIEVHKPDDVVKEEILTNKNIIVSPNPVYWPIKVTLGKNRRDYSGLANWIKANPDKVKIGEVALKALESHGFVSGYYLFVKTDKILNLINIMIGDNIRRVDQIVYKADLDK